jgi:hypothetical protein
VLRKNAEKEEVSLKVEDHPGVRYYNALDEFVDFCYFNGEFQGPTITY